MVGKRIRWLIVSWNMLYFLGMVVCPYGARLHAQSVASVTPPPSREVRRVTVNVKDELLETVLQTIARQAGLMSVFNDALIAPGTRVTLHLRNTSADSAFRQALHGTGLLANISAKGYVVLIRETREPDVGVIMGRVIDATSRLPIAGVNVTIVGQKMAATTDVRGDFRLADIPVGVQTVSFRRIGYRGVVAKTTIKDQQSVTLNTEMTLIATVLTEVVTTATGQRRRIEVGNDIATIAADSVVNAMPISDLSELLSTRIAGLDVASSTGAPGAPSRIRIRGVSSINASKDPIVIHDGVRVYARQDSAASSNLVSSSMLVTSPLDQIDPSSIESIEVLKGPSAVALYGTDAANGVIVITSKRGQVGPARWSVSGVQGTERMVGRWPTQYWGWGTHLTSGFEFQCILTNPTCESDSVSTYQMLNDPEKTYFGRGHTETYRGEVRGGTRGLTYSILGSSTNTTGSLKIPDIDVKLLRAQGKPVPNWLRQPQEHDARSGTVRLDIDVTPTTSVGFTMVTSRNANRSTPLQDALTFGALLGPESQSGTSPTTKLGGSGLLGVIPTYRTKNTSSAIRFTNAVTLNARPWTWLQTSSTAGLDIMTRQDRSVLGRGDCPDCPTGTTTNTGIFATGQGRNAVTSFSTRGSVPVTLSTWLTIRSSVGGNYVQTTEGTLTRRAVGVPIGATSGNNATTQTTTEQGNGRVTAGIYGETEFGLFNRLYVPLAIRRDAGSALGNRVFPIFPKMSLSYVASDEPKFKSLPLVSRLNLLRFRTAFGASGVQPTVTAKLRTYTQSSSVLDNTPVLVTRVTGYGNAALRPERTSELEGGADFAAWHERIAVRLTGYRKRTTDALISLTVPVSVNGGGTRQVNIGIVRNTGLEASVDLHALDGRYVSWQLSGTFARNRNRVERLATNDSLATAQISGSALSTRFVEGYPLFGRWALPIISYIDIDHNGILSQGEVRLGDSAVFLGAPYPLYTAAMHHTVTLFRKLTVNSAFNYQRELTQYNATLLAGINHNAVYNDPHAPLAAQAYLVAAALKGSDIGRIQKVSSLRFDALSVGYILPSVLSRGPLRQRQINVSLQGKNLGLWSRYRGADPNVMSAIGEEIRDAGALPMPRTWQFSFRIN